MRDWTKRCGYKGKIYYVRGDLWECCVYEDVLAVRNRFHVMVVNQSVKRFDNLDEAQNHADKIIARTREMFIELN
jgi:hypothetical protein